VNEEAIKLLSFDLTSLEQDLGQLKDERARLAKRLGEVNDQIADVESKRDQISRAIELLKERVA